jgi:hypothetical protein
LIGDPLGGSYPIDKADEIVHLMGHFWKAIGVTMPRRDTHPIRQIDTLLPWRWSEQARLPTVGLWPSAATKEADQQWAALVAYCQRDALAMVGIHQALTRLASQ